MFVCLFVFHSKSYSVLSYLACSTSLASSLSLTHSWTSLWSREILTCIAVFLSDKWMACQSMDNQIMIFGVLNRFRQNRKKTFKGHMVRCHFVLWVCTDLTLLTIHMLVKPLMTYDFASLGRRLCLSVKLLSRWKVREPNIFPFILYSFLFFACIFSYQCWMFPVRASYVHV